MGRRRAEFRSLGFALVDWVEWFLVHGPGDVEGKPVELDDEFAAFVVRCYEVDGGGRKVRRRCVLSRPKGRAKSELAAFLACAEGLGPVRFDHWAERGEVSSWGYAYELGEPVGRPVTRPGVLCIATEQGQAGNTYDAIRYMLDPESCSPALLEAFGPIDVGLERTNLPGGGTITPETAANTSKDGGRETFVVFDEVHLWVLQRLVKLHQTVLRNLLKRKAAAGWALETTTMFAPGEGSVAESSFQFARAAAEGRLPASDARLLLFDHREASAKWDASKRADRLAGLREVYGPAAAWMDLRAIAASYDDPQTSPAEWQRYWFNRPVSLQGGWLPQAQWDAASVPGDIPDLVDVVLGLDGSFSGDCTALVAVSVADVPHVQVVQLWERPDGARDWRVPIVDVEQAVRDACRRWRVLEVACDPYRWARSMQVLEADGVPVVEFPQTAPRMTPATTRVGEALANAAMTHSGDQRLSRHVSNAVLRVDSRGRRIQKEHKASTARIDLAVAMVMALDRAAWHWAESSSYDPLDSVF
jgi:phage terminase large subunit-like protein